MAGSVIRDNAMAWKFIMLWLGVNDDGHVASVGNGTGNPTLVAGPGGSSVLPMADSDEISWAIDPSRLQEFGLNEDIKAQVVFAATQAAAGVGIDWLRSER